MPANAVVDNTLNESVENPRPAVTLRRIFSVAGTSSEPYLTVIPRKPHTKGAYTMKLLSVSILATLFTVSIFFTPACSDDATDPAGVKLPGDTSSAGSASASASSSVSPDAPFSLIATSPVANATGIIRDTAITLTFSHPVNPASLTTNSVQLTKWWDGAQVSGVLAGSFDVSRNPVVVFTPAAVLDEAYDYKIKFTSTEILDASGRPLTGGSEITFTTSDAISTDLPRVTATMPAAGTSGVFTGARIQIVFSKKMAQASLVAGDTVQLYPTATPASRVTLAKNTTDNPQFTFTPQSALAPNTQYTLLVKKEVKDLLGTTPTNPMTADFTATFTTGAGADPDPLTVASITPANAATGVAVTSDVTIKFSKPVDPATLFLDYTGTAGSVRVSRYSDGSFPETGTLTVTSSATDTTAVFKLDAAAAWEAGRTYYVKLAGIKGLSGATLADTMTSFTTTAPTTGTLADLRAASGPCAIKVENVHMTFFRNYPDNYRAFFLQEAAAGPAIMVLVKNTLPPFHTTDYVYPNFSNVDITVSRVDEYAGMKQVAISSVIDRNSNKTVDWVFANLLTTITTETLGEAYEARLLRIEGWLSNYVEGSSAQNRNFRLYYSAGRYVRMLANEWLIQGVTRAASAAGAIGSKVRVTAPLQQDKDGYFIKPYYYVTNAAMTHAALALPANYPLMLDIVRLAD